MENYNWDEIYWGNSLRDYVSFGLILVLGFIFSGLFARIFSWVAYRLFRRFSKGKFFDEFLRLLKKPFNNLVQLVIVYAACSRLSFPIEWQIASEKEFGLRWLIHSTFLIAIIIGFMRVFKRGVDFIEYVYIHHEESPISPDLTSFIRRLVQILIYLFGFFVILAKAFEIA
jgi:MscS family membrane protein